MKVAVVGSGGLLGRYLLRILKERGHEAIAVSRSSGDRTLDATDIGALGRLMDEARPEAVINAVKPKFSTDEMEGRKEEAWAANVTVPENLAALSGEHGYTLLHLSSEWVYEGKAGEVYSERSLPYPQNFYGFTKAVSEERVALKAPRHIILRSSGLFGLESRNANLFMRVREAAGSGRQVAAVTDQRSQPIYAGEMAGAAIKLLEKGSRGVFNVCGDEYVSRYQLACMFCEAFGWDRSLVVAQEAGARTVRVPKDLRLDMSKMTAEIGPLAPLRKQVQALREESG